jgi:hypothetical protein
LEFRNNDAAQELQKVLDMEHLSLQITFWFLINSSLSELNCRI